MAQFAVQSH